MSGIYEYEKEMEEIVKELKEKGLDERQIEFIIKSLGDLGYFEEDGNERIRWSIEVADNEEEVEWLDCDMFRIDYRIWGTGIEEEEDETDPCKIYIKIYKGGVAALVLSEYYDDDYHKVHFIAVRP